LYIEIEKQNVLITGNVKKQETKCFDSKKQETK